MDVQTTNSADFLDLFGAAPAVSIFFFLPYLCHIELSLDSGAHFAGLIFQEWPSVVGFSRISCETAC